MQKPNLPLIIFCFVALSFAGKAQTMYSPVEPNAKLKKGDWFNIEFANKLEDYSTPVDSINYCDPEDLLQLVLHCEVTNVSKKKINLKITLERLFHITDSGEYHDSYFDIFNDLQRPVMGTNKDYNDQYFEFNAVINLIDDGINYDLKPDKERPYYWYSGYYTEITNQPDFGTPSSVQSSGRYFVIYYSEIERMISAFFKDWSTKEYKLPIPTFGNLQITNFRKYRVIDANIPVQSNTELVIETEESNNNELIEIIERDEFESLSFPEALDKQMVSGITKNGKIIFKFYLENQKELKLKYHDEEITFIVTPGENLHIKLKNENFYPEMTFTGEKIGDNLCEKRFKSYWQLARSDNSIYFYSYEVFHDSLEQATNNLIRELDQYKSQMTAIRYKKKLKMIYYWAMSKSIDWHIRNGKTLNYAEVKGNRKNYTKLREYSFYKNIQPLYDYILKPDFYKEYLDFFAFANLDHGYEKNMLTSEVQGFEERPGLNEAYELLDMFLIGYPKYFYLGNYIVSGSGTMSLHEKVLSEYNHFMATCKYPLFLDQVQKAYEKSISTQQGRSILDLDLNFVKDEKFKKNNGKYKLIGFLKYKIDQKRINELRESIKNVEKQFDLKNGIEMYLIYTESLTDSVSIKLLNESENDILTLIELDLDEYENDAGKLSVMESLTFYNYRDEMITVLDKKNRIIRKTRISDLQNFFINYRREQENLRSQKNYTQLIIIILSSLLFFGFLSWFVIRFRTAQIKNRESARRKVSELELTAIRSQMNPHFIFNAMGSIQNLINQNKVKNANLYLASFARLMRMVLANSNKKLVSMSHELELIETYLKLEQLRVDFTFTISVAENIDPEVEELPGMLIQPFIENAVIHGITPKGKGNIDVAFTKKDNTLICEITDDGVGIDTAKVANGNGLAMKLSEKRLDLLNSQLQDKLKLVVENRMESEQTSGTKITLYIPVG